MAAKSKTRNVRYIHAHKIQADILNIGHNRKIPIRQDLWPAIQELRRELHELKHEVLLKHELPRLEQELNRKLVYMQIEITGIQTEVAGIKTEVSGIQTQVSGIQTEVANIQQEITGGQPSNPALVALFNSKIGQVVTVSTAVGPLTGTVLLVGTNAVELRESTGDLLLIPFSAILSVQ